MANNRSKCPKCSNSLLQKSQQGTRVRIKGPVVFANGICTAQCYWCKSVVELPMDLKKGAGESFIIHEPYKR